MIAIIDYGRGNLRSVQKGFQQVLPANEQIVVSSEPDVLETADGLILPGVGAFGDSIQVLNSTGLSDFIKAQAHKGVPLLGICLGMQLLLDESLEFGTHVGLGLVEGVCRHLPHEEGIKIPHMGWNTLEFSTPRSPLFRGLPDKASVYFVHSYYCDLAEKSESIARTTYGITFTSALQKNNIFGVQFHPEKSSALGLAILGRFGSYVEEARR